MAIVKNPDGTITVGMIPKEKVEAKASAAPAEEPKAVPKRQTKKTAKKKD